MTFGEYRVGISFNPSNNQHVNEIKKRAADFIDYLNNWNSSDNSEAKRLIALSMTHIEDAAMWGVKAVTKEPFNA